MVITLWYIYFISLWGYKNTDNKTKPYSFFLIEKNDPKIDFFKLALTFRIWLLVYLVRLRGLVSSPKRFISRTKYTSNHILKVRGSLKKSIFWMKKLHFWISTPMWRVAKIHFFSSKNEFLSKSLRVVLKPLGEGNKTSKPHQIH